MASVADICNLSFTHYGQTTDIISINPPDDSVEAKLCAVFYPLARDVLLEQYAWTFATKRNTLAPLTSTREDFAYAYALPGDCLKPRKLLLEGYSSDSESEVFEVEDGVLYAGAPSTVTLVYTYKLTSTGKFTPGFISALSFLLASYTAGPVLKDATGRVQGMLLARANMEAAKAAALNANTDRKRSTHTSTARAAR